MVIALFMNQCGGQDNTWRCTCGSGCRAGRRGMAGPGPPRHVDPGARQRGAAVSHRGGRVAGLLDTAFAAGTKLDTCSCGATCSFGAIAFAAGTELWQRGQGDSPGCSPRSARTRRARDTRPGMRGLRTHDGKILRLVLRRGPGAHRAMGRKADDPSVLDMRQCVREVPLLQGIDLVHATSVDTCND